MTPLQLITAGQKLYGRKKWKHKLAAALGVDQSTIHRLTHRDIVPGPYIVAIEGLLDQKRRQDELDRAARKLLPRKFRTRKTMHRKPIPQKIGSHPTHKPTEPT